MAVIPTGATSFDGKNTEGVEVYDTCQVAVPQEGEGEDVDMGIKYCPHPPQSLS